MTSLEIAELVGARHDKVKQSIERLANCGIIELPPMGEIKKSVKRLTGRGVILRPPMGDGSEGANNE